MRSAMWTVGAFLAAAALMPNAGALAQGKPHVEAGMLECKVAGGTGFVFGSTKELTCTFAKSGGTEHYIGTISKFGIDIGQTTQSVISWAVLAPSGEVSARALVGNYAGVTGEVTVGIGVGANALLGGSDKSIVLQPVSVQAQTGLNVAAGIAALSLRVAPH